MSIYGIGVDQVDLKRVKRLLNKSEDKFLKRCFTEQEIKYAKRLIKSQRFGNVGSTVLFITNQIEHNFCNLPFFG